jgi:hypothetical protein
MRAGTRGCAVHHFAEFSNDVRVLCDELRAREPARKHEPACNGIDLLAEISILPGRQRSAKLRVDR